MRIGLVGLGRIGVLHAQTLLSLDEVTELVVSDVDHARAQALQAERAQARAVVRAVPVDDVLDAGLDGLVIATGTMAHAEWVRRAVAVGLPTFCEKPLATTMAETVDVAVEVRASGVPVHVGFQRRVDAGFRAAREAIASGELGFVHTIRGVANDQSPPPAEFIATSGGIFRDCLVHDADAVRFLTGREVASVFAVGANKGAAYFAEQGDVDTGAAVLTLDDGAIAVLSTSRYNGAGQDVRMEVLGERGSVGIGYDHSLALRSTEPGADYPRGPVTTTFFERFAPAFAAELEVFLDVVAGRATPPATVDDALAAFRVVEACALSHSEGRPVRVAEIGSTDPALTHPATPATA